MKLSLVPGIQSRISYRYATVTSACFLTAILHALSCGLLIAFIQSTHSYSFEMTKLVAIIPSHELLWQSICITVGFGGILLLLLVLGWSNLLGRRYQPLPGFAILLMAMSAYATVDAMLLMMTQFADLARDATYNYNPNQLGTIQQLTAIVNQLFSRILLMSCTLESAAGILLCVCSFMTVGFPRLIAWGGLLIWLLTFNVMVAALTKQIDTALTLYIASRIAIVIWCGLFGSMFTVRVLKNRRILGVQPEGLSSNTN